MTRQAGLSQSVSLDTEAGIDVNNDILEEGRGCDQNEHVSSPEKRKSRAESVVSVITWRSPGSLEQRPKAVYDLGYDEQVCLTTNKIMYVQSR